MESRSDLMQIPCPVCGRTCDLSVPASAAVCGRCEADLDAYRAMLAKAQALLQRAARALPANPAQALRLAERSQRLHATEGARRMIILGQLCGRQYQNALVGWLKDGQPKAAPFTFSRASGANGL